MTCKTFRGQYKFSGDKFLLTPVYVLSNVVGPVIIDISELKLPKELLKGKYQPDERVSQPLSDKLMEIFISHQYSTHINEL